MFILNLWDTQNLVKEFRGVYSNMLHVWFKHITHFLEAYYFIFIKEVAKHKNCAVIF